MRRRVCSWLGRSTGPCKYISWSSLWRWVAYLTSSFQLQLFPDFVKINLSRGSATHLNLHDMVHVCGPPINVHSNHFSRDSVRASFWVKSFYFVLWCLRELGTHVITAATWMLFGLPFLAPPVSVSLLGTSEWFIHLKEFARGIMFLSARQLVSIVRGSGIHLNGLGTAAMTVSFLTDSILLARSSFSPNVLKCLVVEWTKLSPGRLSLVSAFSAIHKCVTLIPTILIQQQVLFRFFCAFAARDFWSIAIRWCLSHAQCQDPSSLVSGRDLVSVFHINPSANCLGCRLHNPLWCIALVFR